MTTSEYMPDVKVEVAFNAGYSTADADRVWTDVSAYVELEDDIEIGFGRTDERATCDANTLNLSLDNSDGRFTAGLTSGAYYPNVKIGRPIRVTATPVGGAESVRFLGYVDFWPVEWESGVDTYAKAQVTASSRFSRIGLSDPLLPIIDQEYGVETPLALYPMGEPEGATAASDVSGRQAPALKAIGRGKAPVFGSATGPGVDDLTAVRFTAGNQRLHRSASLLPEGTTACTIEAFVSTNTDTFSMAIAIQLTHSANSDTSIEIGVDGSECAYAKAYDGALGTIVLTGTSVINDEETHHIALTVSGQTATLYVDGVAEDTETDLDWTFPALNRTRVGMIAADPGETFTMVVAHAGFYDAALSAERIAAHAGSGTGFEGETAAERVARYASYAGVPDAEQALDPAATTPMQHIDTTDKTAVELMHLVEATEGGVLFDAQDNTLTYTSRAARYNAATAFILDMAMQEVETGVRPALDRTKLINDVTVKTPEGIGVRAVNQVSVDDYGRHKAELEPLTTDPDQGEAAAWWLVNQYGEPEPRVPDLSVDFLSLPLATQEAIFAASVGTRMGIDGWPAQVGDTYVGGFFIEGYRERISPASYAFTLNVAPASIYDVFELDSATHGVLDGDYPLAY